MSLGEQLRNAREGKGLTISDIARVTFIRAHYLESIERDDFSTIPPSRLRYFIQDYAKSVDLDPSDLLDELPDAPLPSTPARPHAARMTPPTTFPPVAGTTSEDQEFLTEGEESPTRPTSSPRESRRRRPRYAPLDQGNPALVRGLMTVALLLLIGLGIYFLAGGFDGSDEDDAAVALVEEGDTSGNGDDVRILSRSENEGDTAAAEIAAEAGDSLTLQGRATARVWYSIRMDNRQETGTLDSGEVKSWKAEKEFRVSLGNAGGLVLSLNGRSLGTLGPMGISLRGKIIDAGGVREGSTSRPRSTSGRARTPRRTTEENTDNTRLRSLESTEPRRAVEPE